MHIVGGFYREICYIPPWNAVFGSGGRAAAAVSRLSPGSVLHTYAEDFESEAVASLRDLGLATRLERRPSAIVFAYFHSLSHPYIQPPPRDIERQAPIRVNGDAVLRFGFLEGDAVVEGNRVVYDPQTWRDPTPFRANGSVAKELAIVLNELELRSSTGITEVSSAASCLIDQQGAVAVVVKQGTRGALVIERGGRITQVPAYRSPRVFKIGTGDVFSAIFAHHWAEKAMSAGDAADAASRSVAAYCSAGKLPIHDDALYSSVPIGFLSPGRVVLEGAGDTIGQRYTLEEAQFVLRELGTEVSCQDPEGAPCSTASTILVLAEGLKDEAFARVERAKAAGTPIVILREAGVRTTHNFLTEGAKVTVTDDFASAMYFAAWAAAEHSG
jgi:hypothetical protein